MLTIASFFTTAKILILANINTLQIMEPLSNRIGFILHYFELATHQIYEADKQRTLKKKNIIC